MAKTKESRKKANEERRADIFHYLRAALAVLFIVFLAMLAYFTYTFGRMVFTDQAMSSMQGAYSYEITIQEGESALQIGQELEKNNIIESGLAFYLQSMIYDCKMQPGMFILNSGMSSKAICKYLNLEYQNAHQENGK